MAYPEHACGIRTRVTQAYDVITFAREPVLLIRLDENYRAGQICINTACFETRDHILFPTDFSEIAQQVFEVIRQMVVSGVAPKVTLLHVQDKAKISPHLDDKLDEFNRVDAERLNHMRAILEQDGALQVDAIVRFGSPFVEVENLIRELDIKFVVMGSQG